MRALSNEITLIKNARGCWDFDTSKGCAYGMANNTNGCYGDCYAARSYKRHRYDFSKTVLRGFKSEHHKHTIIAQINNIDMPFVRIGVTGDPSENWDHTLNICTAISQCNMVLYSIYKKAIVIITKHWNNLTYKQLKILSNIDVIVNTSVSALDKPSLLNNRLIQYNRLKKYCKSVLRIVSCDFNLHNHIGKELNLIQTELFNNDNVLDTILRVSNDNELVLKGVINTEKRKFLGTLCNASVHNKSTYFGKCSVCPEMCGLNLN